MYSKGDKYPFFGIALFDILICLICVVLISLGYVDAPFEKPDKPQDGPLFEIADEKVDAKVAAEKAEEEAYENIRMCSTPL